MDKPVKEILALTEWMQHQMYEEHTKWTYGNEHDRMSEAHSFILSLLTAEELHDND